MLSTKHKLLGQPCMSGMMLGGRTLFFCKKNKRDVLRRAPMCLEILEILE